MRLLSDRIQEFIDWMEKETDFGEWHDNVRVAVHKKLIECMISNPTCTNSTDTCCGLPLTEDGHCRMSGERIRK